MTMPARIVHISIDCPATAVYDFAHRPENMPKWASGLASGLTRDGDDWLADGGPIGTVRVRFEPKNKLGVIDHRVTLPDGTQVFNAFRIVENGDGCEAMFMVTRFEGVDDQQFEADAAHVRKDLETLKALMEKASR